ncbi:hypothetical protein [Sphingomonas solaris]|uniref:PAS domain-containing protein n=1 Tax=Alterirhizorhabdus solaris TaxID=2529389 RepID=A0A558QT53_9SPHN|nr:hypothetical protein [Sphingomonas solaris]TVV70294.1 hypothetical protein FOY91_19485 [Sphingomonas solaris]
MDTVRSIDSDETDRDYPAAEEPTMDAPPSIGTDERRMHVRAYNYWVSLLHGRSYPAIADLDPATVPDFGPHGVVLDFAEGAGDPAIPFVGAALREEGGHDQPIRHVSDVPSGSLLSRLTDHIDEIIANHAPIGFEAEFVNQRGRNMMYRGILMPFSADEQAIDAIYGVINWKEAPEESLARALSAEVTQALAMPPLAMPVASPVWADGPNAAPQAGGDHPQRFDDEGNPIGHDGNGARARLRLAPARVTVDMPGDPVQGDHDGLVLLVARRDADGRLGILAPVDDPALLDRALRHLGN